MPRDPARQPSPAEKFAQHIAEQWEAQGRGTAQEFMAQIKDPGSDSGNETPEQFEHRLKAMYGSTVDGMSEKQLAAQLKEAEDVARIAQERKDKLLAEKVRLEAAAAEAAATAAAAEKARLEAEAAEQERARLRTEESGLESEDEDELKAIAREHAAHHQKSQAPPSSFPAVEKLLEPLTDRVRRKEHIAATASDQVTKESDKAKAALEAAKFVLDEGMFTTESFRESMRNPAFAGLMLYHNRNLPAKRRLAGLGMVAQNIVQLLLYQSEIDAPIADCSDGIFSDLQSGMMSLVDAFGEWLEGGRDFTEYTGVVGANDALEANLDLQLERVEWYNKVSQGFPLVLEMARFMPDDHNMAEFNAAVAGVDAPPTKKARVMPPATGVDATTQAEPTVASTGTGGDVEMAEPKKDDKGDEVTRSRSLSRRPSKEGDRSRSGSRFRSRTPSNVRGSASNRGRSRGAEARRWGIEDPVRTSLLIRHHFGVLNRNINNVKAFLAQRSRTLEAQEARKAPIGVPKDLPAPSAVVKGKGGKGKWLDAFNPQFPDGDPRASDEGIAKELDATSYRKPESEMLRPVDCKWDEWFSSGYGGQNATVYERTRISKNRWPGDPELWPSAVHSVAPTGFIKKPDQGRNARSQDMNVHLVATECHWNNPKSLLGENCRQYLTSSFQHVVEVVLVDGSTYEDEVRLEMRTAKDVVATELRAWIRKGEGFHTESFLNQKSHEIQYARFQEELDRAGPSGIQQLRNYHTWRNPHRGHPEKLYQYRVNTINMAREHDPNEPMEPDERFAQWNPMSKGCLHFWPWYGGIEQPPLEPCFRAQLPCRNQDDAENLFRNGGGGCFCHPTAGFCTGHHDPRMPAAEALRKYERLKAEKAVSDARQKHLTNPDFHPPDWTLLIGPQYRKGCMPEEDASTYSHLCASLFYGFKETALGPPVEQWYIICNCCMPVWESQMEEKRRLMQEEREEGERQRRLGHFTNKGVNYGKQGGYKGKDKGWDRGKGEHEKSKGKSKGKAERKASDELPRFNEPLFVSLKAFLDHCDGSNHQREVKALVERNEMVHTFAVQVTKPATGNVLEGTPGTYPIHHELQGKTELQREFWGHVIIRSLMWQNGIPDPRSLEELLACWDSAEFRKRKKKLDHAYPGRLGWMMRRELAWIRWMKYRFAIADLRLLPRLLSTDAWLHHFTKSGNLFTDPDPLVVSPTELVVHQEPSCLEEEPSAQYKPGNMVRTYDLRPEDVKQIHARYPLGFVEGTHDWYGRLLADAEDEQEAEAQDQSKASDVLPEHSGVRVPRQLHPADMGLALQELLEQDVAEAITPTPKEGELGAWDLPPEKAARSAQPDSKDKDRRTQPEVPPLTMPSKTKQTRPGDDWGSEISARTAGAGVGPLNPTPGRYENQPSESQQMKADAKLARSMDQTKQVREYEEAQRQSVQEAERVALECNAGAATPRDSNLEAAYAAQRREYERVTQSKEMKQHVEQGNAAARNHKGKSGHIQTRSSTPRLDSSGQQVNVSISPKYMVARVEAGSFYRGTRIGFFADIERPLGGMLGTVDPGGHTVGPAAACWNAVKGKLIEWSWLHAQHLGFCPVVEKERWDFNMPVGVRAVQLFCLICDEPLWLDQNHTVPVMDSRQYDVEAIHQKHTMTLQHCLEASRLTQMAAMESWLGDEVIKVSYDGGKTTVDMRVYSVRTLFENKYCQWTLDLDHCWTRHWPDVKSRGGRNVLGEAPLDWRECSIYGWSNKKMAEKYGMSYSTARSVVQLTSQLKMERRMVDGWDPRSNANNEDLAHQHVVNVMASVITWSRMMNESRAYEVQSGWKLFEGLYFPGKNDVLIPQGGKCKQWLGSRANYSQDNGWLTPKELKEAYEDKVPGDSVWSLAPIGSFVRSPDRDVD